MSFDSTIRRRYWAERLKETAEAYPALALFAILGICVLGIVLASGSTMAVIAIMVLGVVLGRPFVHRFYDEVKEGSQACRRARREGPPPAPGSTERDIERLITTLEKAEQRIIHLETIVTDKEFAWKERLRQTETSTPS